MKIVEINSVNYGSTGKIMLQIADEARKHRHEVWVSYAKSRDNMKKNVEHSILIGNRISRNMHILMTKITGLHGCFSYFSTINFLRKLKKIKPDIIHLHNLHNCYINLPLLFKFIKKNNIRTIWTLHDCWSFTGQCPYFDVVHCDKWKTGCEHCPSYREYPESYVDKTKKMWKLKIKWFTGVKNMTLITPSQWLADLVKDSFLKEYPVKVINNGLDLSIFKPMESDFRKKYNCEDKFVLLGVANSWGYRKGLDVFVELSNRLDKQKYQIVLVGTDEQSDKQLTENIISIHKTHNQEELASIYSIANLFVNPTREETLGMVNVESLACGTPVITFRTGGSPECIDDSCGCVVSCDDVDAMEDNIKRICENSCFNKEDCINHAKLFDMNERFSEYVEMYE